MGGEWNRRAAPVPEGDYTASWAKVRRGRGSATRAGILRSVSAVIYSEPPSI